MGATPRDALCDFKYFSDSQLELDSTREWLEQTLRQSSETQDFAEQRAVGCLLGLAIGDALGAPLEFQPVEYGQTSVRGFGDAHVWSSPSANKFCLKPGQWTDDAAMALCLADSLLSTKCERLDPLDLRLRFVLWWCCGYNNAFADDKERTHRGSVGLGGNISLSIREFQQMPDVEYTQQGDHTTSGNGSLMRLAPSALAFFNDDEQAMNVAEKQSLTSHRGKEAAELCRLLAFIICRAVNSPAPPPSPSPLTADGAAASSVSTPIAIVRDILGDLSAFKTTTPSVARLARAEQEQEGECDLAGESLEERDWRWKADSFKYAPMRVWENPGYIGSYAMDGMAMALHCVWTTATLQEAMLKAANLKGDADTVTAITAQIAGAIYGVRGLPAAWVEAVQQWDGGGRIAARARLLYKMAKGRK
eukprot:CAMPEP_0181303524 /NCGR_PEP_ID=MMETSP1101-20121128/8612_1 /TAXON_ID=46948 /ORGANISM="Rhodomonas abbreviata, Strain Caron Lab Isolate" /LENGTH=419 /DNA_ID=CAMNT_0023409119 /DNA_START=179 /DNA_END=1438 /DNA_ORIENTATION=-